MNQIAKRFITLHLFSILLLLVYSCNPENSNQEGDLKTFKGDLYFKLISFVNFYNAPDSIAVKSIDYLDSIRHSGNLDYQKNLSKNEVTIENYFLMLSEHGLLKKPHFHLELESGQIAIVFVEELHFKELKKFKMKDLRAQNEKVTISLKGKEIQENIVVCKELLSIEKLKGETPWSK